MLHGTQRFAVILILHLIVGTSATAQECGVIHPTTHPKQYLQLVALADFSTLRTTRQLVQRLVDISRMFAEVGDRRGLFPTVYAPVSDLAAFYLRAQPGHIRKPLTRAMWAFAQQYFDTLQRHLTGQSIPIYWRLYYQSALLCQIHPHLVVSYGLLAHLSFDLKWALLQADVSDGLFPHYLLLGNTLGDAKSAIIDDVGRLYHINLTPLLDGLWIGRTFNQGARRRNLSTLLTFNALRTEAWMSSRAHHYTLGVMDGMINQGQLLIWRTRIALLQTLLPL